MYFVDEEDDDFDDEGDSVLYFADDPLRRTRPVSLNDFLPKANIAEPFDWGELCAKPKPPAPIVLMADTQPDGKLVIDDFRVAAATGNLHVVKNFLSTPEFKVDTELKDQWTGLLVAAIAAQDEVVLLLLKSGADANHAVRGFTPLMAAVCSHADCDKDLLEKRIVSCINHLVEFGAKINAVDVYRMAAMHFAAKKNRIQAAKCLLDNNANVNAQDSNNDTPLHVAAKFGHGQLIRLLLESGADLNRTNSDGLKPEDTAISNGFSEIGDLLSRYRRDSLIPTQVLGDSVPREQIRFQGLVTEDADDEDAVAKVLHSDFQTFLSGCRVPELEAVFVRNNITQLPDLLKLNEEDLDKMAILSEPKRKVMAAIESFRVNCSAEVALPVPKKHVSSPDMYKFLVNVTRHLKYIEATLCSVERRVSSDPCKLQVGIDEIPPNGLEKEFAKCRNSSVAIQTALKAVDQDLRTAKKLGISRAGLITEEDVNIRNQESSLATYGLLLAAGVTVAGLCYACGWRDLRLK